MGNYYYNAMDGLGGKYIVMNVRKKW